MTESEFSPEVDATVVAAMELAEPLYGELVNHPDNNDEALKTARALVAVLEKQSRLLAV